MSKQSGGRLYIEAIDVRANHLHSLITALAGRIGGNVTNLLKSPLAIAKLTTRVRFCQKKNV